MRPFMWRRFGLFCFCVCAPKLATSPGTEVNLRPFSKQVFLTEEDKCCYNIVGEKKKKMGLCQYDKGNTQRHIRCAWSQGENKVIALHLNLSADESSLEGKNIFAHKRFIRNLTNHISVLSGILFP